MTENNKIIGTLVLTLAVPFIAVLIMMWISVPTYTSKKVPGKRIKRLRTKRACLKHLKQIVKLSSIAIVDDKGCDFCSMKKLSSDDRPNNQ